MGRIHSISRHALGSRVVIPVVITLQQDHQYSLLYSVIVSTESRCEPTVRKNGAALMHSLSRSKYCCSLRSQAQVACCTHTVVAQVGQRLCNVGTQWQ
jgi:hypothetical protein